MGAPEIILMKTDTENLISNLLHGGRLEVQGGKLLVSPSSLANLYREEITRLKPEIMLRLGHCPICGRDLVIKIEDLREKPARHTYCPTAGHYDKWEK